MADLGKVRVSATVFETPSICIECPMYRVDGMHQLRRHCNHPKGPDCVKAYERHADCPLSDFVFDVTFGEHNTDNG